MDEQRREIFKVQFEKVKNHYYRHPIDGPIFNTEGTAFFNFLNNSISINPKFVKEMEEELDLETILTGIFTHEFGHYRFHPRSLPMHIYLSFKAEEIFKEKAESIYQMFTDFENDHLIFFDDLLKNELKELRKATFNHVVKDGLDPVTAAFYLGYNKRMNLDVAVDFSQFDTEMQIKINYAVDELNQIVIKACTSIEDERDRTNNGSFNYGLQYSQLYRFGKALEPLFTEKENTEKDSNEEESEESNSGHEFSDSSGSKLLRQIDIQKLSKDLQSKIEEEMRKLIKVLSREEYEKLKKHFLSEDKLDVDKSSQQIGTITVETGLADTETVRYYRDAAKEFGIYIRPKRALSFSSVKIPFGSQNYNPTDNTLEIDMRFSGGRILPGLTNKKRKEVIPYPATKEIVPNLVLYKDGSGSMPNPKDGKDYATIAGAIFVLSYLRSGASVGVTIFDADSNPICFSKKEDELLAILCGYKGGGTYIDMEKLRDDLEKKVLNLPIDIRSCSDKELQNSPLLKSYLKHYERKNAMIKGYENLNDKAMTDFVIITDGGIDNLGEFLSYLKEHQNFRPTILHSGNYEIEITGYDGKTSGVYDGITIHKADSPKDIIALARKTVGSNILAKYHV